MHKLASTPFATRVRALRKERQWSQEQAAEACGLDYKLYQFYELGIKNNPGLKTLQKLANGFGIQLYELLMPVSAKKPPVQQRIPPKIKSDLKSFLKKP